MSAAMDFSSPTAMTLPNEAMQLLGDGDLPLAYVAKEFMVMRKLESKPDSPIIGGMKFMDSLRLKMLLDTLERLDGDTYHANYASMGVHAEFTLGFLNAETPLRVNPFLSHWVEALPRLENRRAQLDRKGKGHVYSSGVDYNEEKIIFAIEARCSVIKSILLGKIEVLYWKSPNMVLDEWSKCMSYDYESFNVAPFVAILEDEGIYDRTSAPKASSTSPVPEEMHKDVSATSELLTPPNSSRSQLTDESWDGDQDPHETLKALGPWPMCWSHEIDPEFARAHYKAERAVERAAEKRREALRKLAKLPLELPSLERINALLADGDALRAECPKGVNITPVELAREFVQHCLHLLEDEIRMYGREVFVRAVRLLVLFVRNLVVKALVDPEELFFEIMELTTRYIWVKEVRDLRSFMEGGEEVEA